MDLTELETKVMRAARKTDYGDCYYDGQWSFAVCEKADLDEKVYRGVVASLIKKGLVTIWDNGDINTGKQKGNFSDMVFEYTDDGKKLFDEGKL
jgi:hypothetical protein